MKLVACVKRVPATDTRVRVAADGASLDPQGVEWIVSPYDEYAVEEAIRIRERVAGSELTVLSLGAAEAAKEIRTCLAMGADRGVLLEDAQAYARDVPSVAEALAASIREIAPDLAFFGRQAVDDDSAAVGPFVAALLGWPALTFVRKLELGDGLVRGHREIEGATEVVEARLPAVVTAEKGLNEPRYPSLKGIMAAKKKPLDVRPAPKAAARTRVVALELPPSRPPGKVVGKGKEAVPELLRLLREEARAL